MRVVFKGQCMAAAATPNFFDLSTVSAQGYPSHDIHVVCGFSPGTGPDIATRYVANLIRQASGATVVVENRPGALSTIAAQVVAKSKADGYTIFVTSGNSTFATNPHLFKHVLFDPIKDFTPVSTLWKGPFVFAVALDSPNNTLQELTTALKTKTAPIKFGYSNSIGLAASKLYAVRIGIDPIGVSYRSTIDATMGWSSMNSTTWRPI